MHFRESTSQRCSTTIGESLHCRRLECLSYRFSSPMYIITPFFAFPEATCRPYHRPNGRDSSSSRRAFTTKSWVICRLFLVDSLLTKERKKSGLEPFELLAKLLLLLLLLGGRHTPAAVVCLSALLFSWFAGKCHSSNYRRVHQFFR